MNSHDIHKLSTTGGNVLYPSQLQSLPIYDSLDEICVKLKNSKSHFLVLTAETAAGKSTGIPFGLMKHFDGNILMLEPRRLAAINIASRVSLLLGEEVGDSCGYIVHLDKKISDKTRFCVMTEAVLVRKMQSDPLLDGVSVVVIDEFHERSIHADLALALLKEITAVRDDLYVIVMSATMDTGKLSNFLGADIHHVEGRQFDVNIEYDNNLSPYQAVEKMLKTVPVNSSVLVFLPGISEIKRLQMEIESRLNTLSTEYALETMVLHSSVPISEQKKVLMGISCGMGADSVPVKRVILSSSIAETSVTVPDVKAVIDTGWCRTNVFNQNVQMNNLVTRRVGQFNADQRAGRAGRVSNGYCLRLWSKNDVLEREFLPEIMRSDLSALVLECAEWGTDALSLEWLDKPSESAIKTAESLLEQLRCLKDGKITDIGKACLSLGLNPRLGCVALSGIQGKNVELSTKLAVKYSSGIVDDLRKRAKFESELNSRVQNLKLYPQNIHIYSHEFTEFSTGCALLCGYPDRFAVQTGENSNLYQFPSGRVASIVEEIHPLPHYIVAPNVDSGAVKGKIYEFEVLDERTAQLFLELNSKTRTECRFDGDKLCKTEYKAYGKIVLSEKSLKVEPEDYANALCNEVKNKGIRCLPLSESSESLLLRCQFYVENNSSDTEISDNFKNLKENVGEWLPPFIVLGKKVDETAVYNGLMWYLNGDRINKTAPVEMILPNGKKRRLLYEVQNGKVIVCLEVIIQHIFGCFETPKVMGQNVLLRLLSPARRPLQVTDDLENFWKNTWPEICTEMRGRYPKHNWDYRVTEE